MRAALKRIHRLEGLGTLGPGLVSGCAQPSMPLDMGFVAKAEFRSN